MLKNNLSITRLLKYVGSVALATAFSVAAAAYPDKPIELVVPFPPGGTADSSARALAKAMEERLGETVVVANRPGAGTLVGTSYVARSKPDGYTLFWLTIPFSINHTLYEDKRDYDSFEDFQMITDVVSVPLVLTVNKETPVTNVKEFIQWAKSDDAPLTFGSSGNGGSTHLAPVLFASTADLDFTHVPYQGSAPSMKDLMAGLTDFIMDTAFLVAPQAKEDGKLRILAQSGATRSALLPDVPTLKEEGFEDFEVTSWFSIAAPGETPKEIVEMLNAVVNDALQSDELNNFYTSQGLTVEGGSIEDAEKHLAAEVQRWAKAIEESGVQAD